MVRPFATAFLISLVAATYAAPGPALAGSPYYQGQANGPSRPDPNPHGIPNVPNLQGCIPLCERDQNPCDPPVFKQADGRCNYMD